MTLAKLVQNAIAQAESELTEREVNQLGNSDMSESDEYLYSLLSALAKYNPTMTGRSTPALGSPNDYQRGRD